jgi:carboxymethylenebutenolidase
MRPRPGPRQRRRRERLGVTGFCWGGRIAWLYDAHSPRVRAAVAWYGRLVGEVTPNTARASHRLAGALHGPVLGLYGGQDPGIPLDTSDKMKAAAEGGAARRRGNRSS